MRSPIRCACTAPTRKVSAAAARMRARRRRRDIPFGPEVRSQNREIGVKSDLFDDRLRVNASVFEMVYRDIEQGSAGVDVNGTLATVTTNAGHGVRSRASKLETQLRIGEHWTVDNSLAHLDYQLHGSRQREPRVLLGRRGVDGTRQRDPRHQRRPGPLACVHARA